MTPLEANPETAQEGWAELLETASATSAWLYRWGSHVGSCKGGAACTCGLTAISKELLLAVARVEAAQAEASQPGTEAEGRSAPNLDLLPTGDGWRPIETAPKDGTDVLLLGDRGAAVGSWDTYTLGDPCWVEDYRGKGNGNEVTATHWMPLPPAPSIAGEGRPAPKTEGGQS